MDIADIHLTKVGLKDLNKLQEISRRTFNQTFASMNKPENLKFFLKFHYSTKKLSSEIQNPHSLFLFGQTSNEILGYLKLNRGNAQTVLPNDGGLEIERIYIDQSCQGMGIGQIFLGAAVKEAEKIQAAYIWLGVWEKNEPAIRFYKKNGFTQYSEHIFNLGDDPQTDLLMIRRV